MTTKSDRLRVRVWPNGIFNVGCALMSQDKRSSKCEIRTICFGQRQNIKFIISLALTIDTMLKTNVIMNIII